jgi:hypothetical protein
MKMPESYVQNMSQQQLKTNKNAAQEIGNKYCICNTVAQKMYNTICLYSSFSLNLRKVKAGNVASMTVLYLGKCTIPRAFYCLLHMEMINPFRSYLKPRLTVRFSCSAPMSEYVRHGFCCVCSTAVGACPMLFLV